MLEPGLEELGSVVPTYRTIGNEHKAEHKKFHFKMRKHFLTVSVTMNCHRLCSEIMWSLCSWRYLKATWPCSWMTSSGWSCLSGELGPDDLHKSIPTSTILWFCVSPLIFLVNTRERFLLKTEMFSIWALGPYSLWKQNPILFFMSSNVQQNFFLLLLNFYPMTNSQRFFPSHLLNPSTIWTKVFTQFLSYLAQSSSAYALKVYALLHTLPISFAKSE